MSSNQIGALMQRNFPWLFATVLLANIVAAGVRAIHKRRRGEFIFRPTIVNARFNETWISGDAGLLASARNCLWVTLTDDAILIGLHFPFSLFVPRWFGLEARIAAGNVTSIENKQSVF